MAKRGRGSSDDEVVIKKYGNRRLYDTSQSRYITLDDLADIIKEGRRVRVVEASSDRDLTRQVLTQVILEQQEVLEMFPVELLHAAIRVRGTLDQAPFTAFLSTMTRQMTQAGSVWSEGLSALFGAAAARTRPTATARPAPPPEDTGAPTEPPGEAAWEDVPAAKAEKEDLEDIRHRMDRLLGRLGKR